MTLGKSQFDKKLNSEFFSNIINFNMIAFFKIYVSIYHMIDLRTKLIYMIFLPIQGSELSPNLICNKCLNK